MANRKQNAKNQKNPVLTKERFERLLTLASQPAKAERKPPGSTTGRT